MRTRLARHCRALRDAIDALAAASTDNRRIQRFVKGLKEPLDRFAESLQRLVADDDKLRSATAERDAAADAVLRAAAVQRAAAMASQTDAHRARCLPISTRRVGWVC